MFVIRFWTASCSNQVDEIDFFFFPRPQQQEGSPRFFLGFVRGRKPERKEAAALDFCWRQRRVNICRKSDPPPGGRWRRSPSCAATSSGKSFSETSSVCVFWPLLLSRSPARHCVRVGSSCGSSARPSETLTSLMSSCCLSLSFLFFPSSKPIYVHFSGIGVAPGECPLLLLFYLL